MTTFLTLIQAAKLSGYSLRHFRRLVEVDRMKLVEIKGKYFLMRAEFDAWLAHRKQAA